MSIAEFIDLLIILIISLISSYFDIKTRKILDSVVIAGILLIISVELIFGERTVGNLVAFFLSGIVSGLIYYMTLIFTKGKLGMGDVYFGIFQGLCLSVEILPVCILMEIILTLVICLKKLKNGKSVPFIPFMAAGLILTFLYKTKIFI